MKRLAWLLLPLLVLAISINAFAQEGADAKDADKKPNEKADEKPDETDTEKDEEAPPDKAALDKKAPDFTLTNADGKEVTLSGFKGKIVVLEWVNLDCPWCKAHYEQGDALVKLQAEYRKDEIVWLTICSSAEGKQGNFDAETLKKRIDKAGMDSASYLLDADGTAGRKYEAKTTPHCYVIDKEGKLKYRGALDNLRERRKDKALDEVNYVKLAVDALKNDKQVETTETTPYG
ncbi:MAG: redoxin domain-containing protein [Planctomycetes bacterium]|nr:redoxin domain-containing protein [Planctomycetota bacterium]